MFAFTFNSQGQKRFLVAAPDGEQGFFCHNPVPAAAFIPRCPRGNPPGARWPSLLSCAATGRSPAAPRPPRGSGLGISMSGAGWSQAAEEGAGTWERKSKPVRRSCIYFFLCHADVKRTVIYSGISVILGILEIFAVSQGIVGIRGVFSNKFLAMSKKGKLHASARFTVDCHFRERFQENSYNTYASAVHRSADGMPALKYLCPGAGAFPLPGGVPRGYPHGIGMPVAPRCPPVSSNSFCC
uniref:Fibroblast growth factor n=1 Tax=Serinus canaria TaxID=9135 RepID=A0A8C9MPM0_SERCA